MTHLIQIKNLKVDFEIHGGVVHAVKDFSFDIRAGRIVALVGESGSGKSVTSQAIMGLLSAKARIAGGEILFFDPDNAEGPVDLARLAPESKQMRSIRGGRIAVVFQDAMACFSHLHTIGDQVSEALFLHRDVGVKEGLDRPPAPSASATTSPSTRAVPSTGSTRPSTSVPRSGEL